MPKPKTGRRVPPRALERDEVHEAAPRPKDVVLIDDAAAIAIGLKPYQRHPVTSGLHHLYELFGGEFETEVESIPYLLDSMTFETTRPCDWCLWTGDLLVAVLRLLPDGRRVVFTFAGQDVGRDVYPPHEEHPRAGG
jgi:hypothetical protein